MLQIFVHRHSLAPHVNHGPVLFVVVTFYLGDCDVVIEHFEDESIFSSSVERTNLATARIILQNQRVVLPNLQLSNLKVRKRHVEELDHRIFIVSHCFSTLEDKIPALTRQVAICLPKDRNASVRDTNTNVFVSHFSFKCFPDDLFVIEVGAAQDFTFSFNLDFVQSQIVINNKHLVILVLPLSLYFVFLLGCLYVVVIEWVELKRNDGSDEWCCKLSSFVD